MKNLKLFKIAGFILLIAFLVPSLIMAQKQRFNQEDALKSELNLTDKQMEAIKTIKKESMAKMKALKDGGSFNPEQRKAIQEEREAAMMAVLDDNQKALFLEKKAQRMEHREKKKAAREELKTYRKNSVEPVILEQRVKFEEEISAEDKQAIDALRTKVDVAKTEMKARRSAAKEDPKTDSPRMGKQEKKHGHHKHNRYRAHAGKVFKDNPELKEEAMRLVEKYENELNEVEETLAPQREKWAAEQKNIMAKYQMDDAKADGRKGHHHKKGHNKDGLEKENHLNHHKIGFLLMRPQGHDQRTMRQNPSSTLHQMKAYPNPTSGAQTLEFNVAAKGIVRVDLIDMGGKVVENLFNQKLDKGPQSIQVELPQVSGNSYYYLITDKVGTSTLPLVIAK